MCSCAHTHDFNNRQYLGRTALVPSHPLYGVSCRICRRQATCLVDDSSYCELCDPVVILNLRETHLQELLKEQQQHDAEVRRIAQALRLTGPATIEDIIEKIRQLQMAQEENDDDGWNWAL